MMIIYVWARRNPHIIISFLGVHFRAPYLPYVFFAFSFLLNGEGLLVDALGIAVGHSYYFLEDVFPYRSGGVRILKTPLFLRRLLDDVEEPETPQPEQPNPEQPQPQANNFDNDAGDGD